MLVRALKGLEDIISLDVVHWHMQENGWPFKDGYEDSLYGAKFIREIYFKAQPDYVGRYTVPVLWDKKTQTIGMSFFLGIVFFVVCETKEGG